MHKYRMQRHLPGKRESYLASGHAIFREIYRDKHLFLHPVNLHFYLRPMHTVFYYVKGLWQHAFRYTYSYPASRSRIAYIHIFKLYGHTGSFQFLLQRYCHIISVYGQSNIYVISHNLPTSSLIMTTQTITSQFKRTGKIRNILYLAIIRCSVN